ncbi:MAG: hypothetical protein R3C01_02150 [Planctomycetaceae bacterium]
MSPNEQHEPSGEQNRIDRIQTEKSSVKRSLARAIEIGKVANDPQVELAMKELRAEQLRDRERQIKRYQLAAMSYLGAMLRSQDAVSTVWERVVDKWLDGRLSQYDESQSFRRYLKAVLRNEVFSYGSEQKRERQQGPVPMNSEFDHADKLEVTASEAFDSKLQDSIIKRAMESVEQEDTLYSAALKSLMSAAAEGSEPPSSRELAETLSTASHTRISEENARQIKTRARQMLSRKIVEQTGLLIQSTDLDEIGIALRDLNLLSYSERALMEMKDKRR